MELMWKTCAILLVLSLTGQKLSRAQNECPTVEEAMEDIVISDTKNERQELRQTSRIEGQVKESVSATDAAEIIAALSMRNITTNVDGKTPYDIKIPGNEYHGLEAELDIAIPYYHNVCPHKWFLMKKYWWHWWVWQSSGSTITIQYCFTYWWLWATYCPTKLCLTNYYPFELYAWNPKHRCFPVYRIIWVPVVCYQYTIKNGKGVGLWKNWTWKKVYVPRGCCCRKYWYWLSVNAAKCPAVPAPQEPN